VEDPQALLENLPQLLAQADVAAVLLRLKSTDPRTLISRIKALAPVIQDAGAALLLDAHVELVARGGADGAHVSGIEALKDALPTLKPERIAGCGGLKTRHDSMAAGELGADYVLFGEPDERGQRPSVEAIAERLQWWDELFEPPCVGFAGSCEEAGEFARAGADFVLVGDFIWADPRGAGAALKQAEQTIAQAHAAVFGNAQAREGMTPE
jgi:thiamine-phosphate pyrophosphorylase